MDLETGCISSFRSIIINSSNKSNVISHTVQKALLKTIDWTAILNLWLFDVVIFGVYSIRFGLIWFSCCFKIELFSEFTVYVNYSDRLMQICLLYTIYTEVYCNILCIESKNAYKTHMNEHCAQQFTLKIRFTSTSKGLTVDGYAFIMIW